MGHYVEMQFLTAKTSDLAKLIRENVYPFLNKRFKKWLRYCFLVPPRFIEVFTDEHGDLNYAVRLPSNKIYTFHEGRDRSQYLHHLFASEWQAMFSNQHSKEKWADFSPYASMIAIFEHPLGAYLSLQDDWIAKPKFYMSLKSCRENLEKMCFKPSLELQYNRIVTAACCQRPVARFNPVKVGEDLDVLLQ